MPDGSNYEYEPAQIEAAGKQLQAVNSSISEIFNPLRTNSKLLGKVESKKQSIGFNIEKDPIYEGKIDAGPFQLFEWWSKVIVPSSNGKERNVFARTQDGFRHEIQEHDSYRGWYTVEFRELDKKKFFDDPNRFSVTKRGTDEQIADSIRQFQEAAAKIVASYPK